MSKDLTTALAVALALTAPAALADVTPAEVWASWQQGGQGRTTTAASTQTTGDSLIVSGINTVIAGEGGNTSILLGEVRFRDNGDGTVAVLFPDSFPVLVTTPLSPGSAQTEEITVTLTIPGHAITASGTATALSYQTDFPTAAATATVVDATDGSGAVDIAVNLTGASGTYQLQAADLSTDMTHAYKARTVDLKLTSSGGADLDGTFALSLTDLAGGLGLSGIPPDGGPDFQLALNQGMTLDLNASYGIGSFDVTATDQGNPLKINGTLGGGDFAARFTDQIFRYQAMAKAMSLNVAATDPSSGQPFSLSATLASTASSAEIAGPNWADSDDFNAALKRGVTLSASADLGPAMVDFTSGQTAPNQTGPKTSLTAQIGGADTRLAMNDTQLGYDLNAKALSFSVAAPDLSMPEGGVDLTELALSFVMPLMKSDTPEPFGLLLKIIDLDLADGVWALFDPSGLLPRDPATLILDAKGSATLTQDITDDAVIAGTPPGLLNALDLPQLLLRIAGAEVAATGAFTFDNSDTTTFPGIPLPTGKLDITALGLNGLIDTLVNMGILSSDEAMQARMLIAVIANSSPDKDEMTSVLEFRDKGFFANGARLQ